MSNEKLCPSGHVIGEGEAVCGRDGMAPVVNENENDGEAVDQEESAPVEETNAPEVPVSEVSGSDSAPAELTPETAPEEAIVEPAADDMPLAEGEDKPAEETPSL